MVFDKIDPFKTSEDNLRWQVICFVIIAVINLYTYYPSVFHMPRGDQWSYLIDTANTNNWSSLIGDFYSYNRVRTVFPGDAQLFRPLLFFFLGTEKWLFGTYFFYWQITGIVLHLVIIWVLLRLLLQVSRGIVAPFFVFFFSTLHVIQEMVIWHHINGYILFMLFILIALYHTYVHIKEGQSKIWRLMVIMGSLLLACFTFEAGIFYTFLFLIFLLASRDKKSSIRLDWKWTLVLFIPIALYIAGNAVDAAFRGFGSQQSKYGIIFQSFNLGKAIFYLIIVPLFWFCCGLFPSVLKLTYGPRFRIDLILNWNSILVVINFVANAILFLAFVKGLSFDVLKKQWKFIVFVFMMFFCFVNIIVFGRFLERGLRYALSNTYYFYIAWLFFLIIIYSLIDINKLLKSWSGNRKWVLIIALATLAYLNGNNTYSLNRDFAESLIDRRLFIEQLNNFVASNHSKPDFSFAFLCHPPEDEVIVVDKLKRLPSGESRLFKDQPYYSTDVLYQTYINKKNPRYVLLYKKNILEILSPDEVKSIAGTNDIESILGQEPVICPPKIVEKGYKGFNIFFYANKYYGLAQEEGSFSVDKVNNKKYKMVFARDTVTEVKSLIDKIEFFRKHTIFGIKLESLLTR